MVKSRIMPSQAGFQKTFVEVDGICDIDNPHDPAVTVHIHLLHFDPTGRKHFFGKCCGGPTIGLATLGAIHPIEPDALLRLADEQGKRVSIGYTDNRTSKVMCCAGLRQEKKKNEQSGYHGGSRSLFGHQSANVSSSTQEPPTFVGKRTELYRDNK